MTQRVKGRSSRPRRNPCVLGVSALKAEVAAPRSPDESRTTRATVWPEVTEGVYRRSPPTAADAPVFSSTTRTFSALTEPARPLLVTIGIRLESP